MVLEKMSNNSCIKLQADEKGEVLQREFEILMSGSSLEGKATSNSSLSSTEQNVIPALAKNGVNAFVHGAEQ